MVQQVGKTEAAALIETAKRVILEEEIIKFVSAVCLSQVSIFSVAVSLPLKDLSVLQGKAIIFSGIYTDFQMIHVFIYPKLKDWISWILLCVHKTVSVNNIGHTHLCWALILTRCEKHVRAAESNINMLCLYFLKSPSDFSWGSVPVTMLWSLRVWSHSFCCAFPYFFVVPCSLFCTKNEQGSAKKQLLNVLSPPCSLQGSVPDFELFKSYSEYRITNVIVSIPLAIKMFKRHQWIRFHNMPVRWAYIISNSQMESWSRDKKIKKDDLWLRISLTSFGLLSFFFIIYRTGRPGQNLIPSVPTKFQHCSSWDWQCSVWQQLAWNPCNCAFSMWVRRWY